MPKIWSGGASGDADAGIDDIMVRDDNRIDGLFLEYEVQTLLAYQIQMMRQGLINKESSVKILSSLLELLRNGLEIRSDLEDVHGNVENFVLNRSGEAGRNLRMFLSRNEQIHTDIILFGKWKLLKIASSSVRIARALLKKRDEVKGQMPGYTHYRQGMVISLHSYFDYLASIFSKASEELLMESDNVERIPFGYGSGFGSPGDVDFRKVAELLGMKWDGDNPQYLALRRGMDEADLAYPLLKLLINVSRLSHDLIMFSGDEMPIFGLPDGFTTGSSLMANKRNPDFLEMIQGYTTEAVGKFNTLMHMIANKSSGYHRDFQVSKKIMVEIFERVESILEPLPRFFQLISVDAEASKLIVKNSSHATANAKGIFRSGNTWKDAYAEVGRRILSGEGLDEIEPDEITSVSEKNLDSLAGAIETGISKMLKVREHLISTANDIVGSLGKDADAK